MKPSIWAKSACASLLLLLTSVNAHANSVGFVSEFVDVSQDLQITITVEYDFTSFAMFGGGLDLIFDTTALEFVSFVQAPLPADAQAAASPVGELTAPGQYTGFGIGTFEFFNGMTSAGAIGTFTFNIFSQGTTGATPCGVILCLSTNATNPFVSLAGNDVSADLLAAGISQAAYSPIGPVPFPLPAAVWFMFSGLGVLWAMGRRSTR